jgi:hypothetical protein
VLYAGELGHPFTSPGGLQVVQNCRLIHCRDDTVFVLIVFFSCSTIDLRTWKSRQLCGELLTIKQGCCLTLPFVMVVLVV